MKTKFVMLLLAGVVLLGACKGRSSNYEAINNSSKIDSTSLSESDTSARPKLVKTGNMRFKVKNVQQTSKNITSLTIKNKGMVMHHQMESFLRESRDFRISDDSINRVSAFNTVADMTIKIPSEHLEDFMTQVANMGTYVTFKKIDREDKSLDFLSSKLKFDNRKELIAQQKRGYVTIKDPMNVMLLKDDMTDGQINNLRIDDAVKFSIVTLSFYQSNTIIQEHVANDDPSSYQLPFFSRLANSFYYGWHLFTELIIGIVNFWIFILAVTGTWMLTRFYKRKNTALSGTIKS